MSITGRSARALLAPDRQAAADLYSGSLKLSLAPLAHADDFEQKVPRALAEHLGLMAAHVEVDLPEQERESFYESVLEALDKIESDLGDLVRPYLDQVVKEFDEQGLFRRLRKGDERDK